MLSDSHAHLTGYEPEQLKQVIERARKSGVEVIVGVGMTLESSAEVVSVSDTYAGVVPAVGIHPWNPELFDFEKLKELALKGKVRALGEIGLDFASEASTKQVQKQVFTEQVKLAKELGLPINVHCRQAHSDMMEILRDEKASEIGGQIHGFSGDQNMLQDWLELGFYVSIGRSILHSEELDQMVKKIPLDRLLLETDSYGGSAADPEGIEPASVRLVAEKVAQARGETVEEIGNVTTANLKRLLKSDT